MGITLEQLTSTIGKVKDYVNNKFPVVSPNEDNAILSNENGIFVEDKQPQLDELKEKFDTISKYQKYVNVDLEYAYFTLPSQTRGRNSDYILTKNIINGIEYTANSFYLKSGKTYKITAHVGLNISAERAAQYQLYNKTSNVYISQTGYSISVSYNSKWNECDINCIYCPTEDCEVSLRETATYNPAIATGYITVQEIGHSIIIDPVEHVNKVNGIEDTPVGHIISHMGTETPKHYLVCDGTEYNITDYPYLAQHMIDSFGSVNYFGGDGETTFAVPDLRGEFLRGSGTATRDTGSGAEVGEHQEPTEHIYTRIGGSKTIVIQAGGANNIKNAEKLIDSVKGEVYTNFGSTATNTSYKNYTSRPTNTAVLYCIKYEPTYYMVRQNTNYMQPSLYSEEEKVVGCWIDGKPLYEKTMAFGSLPNAALKEIAHNIENVDKIWIFNGYVYDNNSDIVSLLGASKTDAKTQWDISVSKKMLRCFTGYDRSNLNAIIIVQYTKTTDEENSFTTDMIQDYTVRSDIPEPYSDEQVINAINELW